ncbi:MAG: hypothetical protein GKR89_31835 [Candidatus Latescibacteria bacterium]|nr:hypothetical protein [Candidatus Latescibacterota bacterium]
MPAPNQQTLLFVDDHHILYRSGTRRNIHPMQRHGANPVIPPTHPWELAIGWMSVYRNPDSGQYQLWYQAYTAIQKPTPTPDTFVCYAESDDGLSWSKPALGLFPYKDIATTNIVMVGNGGHSIRYANSVVVDPADPDPDKRYKMGYFDFPPEGATPTPPGLWVAFSPDGIHWTKHPQAPLVAVAYFAHGDPVPFAGQPEAGPPWHVPLTMSDTVDIFWDPVRQLWAWYGKSWIDGPGGDMGWKHGMARTESTDFIHWSTPELLLTPDDDDPPHLEFHSAPVFYCDGAYFCLNQVLDRATQGGVIDIELGLSRDGLNFQRPFRKTLFLERNQDPAAFDAGCILTNAAPVILDDEIRFYYGGYDQGATGADDTQLTSGIGLATLPRGRFAGISPVPRSDHPTLPAPLEHIGQVTLKPLDLTNVAALTLNADASQGSIRVEILTERGLRIAGFTKDDAHPISGDSLHHPVTWRAKSLANLGAGRFIVRIHLDRATVYAAGLVES